MSKKVKIINILDSLILASIILFIFSFFKVNFMKNISCVVGSVSLIVYFFYDKKKLLNNFLSNIKNHKKILILTLLFYLIIFIISLFPFEPNYPSFKLAFKEFKKSIIFLIISLFYFDGDFKKSKIIFYTISITLLDAIVVNIYESFKENLILNGKDFILIYRKFSNYMELFFAFSLAGIIYSKNKIFKFLLIIISLFGLICELLTGARGSYLAIFISIFLFIFFARKDIKFNKKLLKIFALLSILLIPAGALLVYNSKHLKFKLSQFDSSRRDVILSTRLPLLFNSSRALIGIGYGFENYTYFLNKMNTKNIDLGPKGVLIEGKRFYSHDEPTFIAQFFHYGIFSLIYPVIVFYMIYLCFIKFNSGNFFMLPLALSMISYFIIRGLFEKQSLVYLFYLITFYILLDYKKEKDE